MNNNEVPAAKSLRWLAMQFPKVENPQDDVDRMQNCINLYCTNAAYLIECQNAEIERYKSVLPYLEHQNMDFCGVLCDFAEELINKAKADAIKEFAKRLKETKIKPEFPWDDFYDFYVTAIAIDTLVKEMTGEDNDTIL